MTKPDAVCKCGHKFSHHTAFGPALSKELAPATHYCDWCSDCRKFEPKK